MSSENVWFSLSINQVFPANATLLKIADLIAVDDQAVSQTTMLCSVFVDILLTNGLKQSWLKAVNLIECHGNMSVAGEINTDIAKLGILSSTGKD